MGQTNFLQSLGWAVLNSLWQMAFLWVIYQIIAGIFKPAKSSTKSLLASLLLISGFTWFIYTFISIFTSYNVTDAISSPGFVNTAGYEQLNNWLQQTLPVASIIYLVLLILPLLRFGRNYRYVQLIRNYGITKANVEWRMFVKKVAAQIGIKKTVRIWISELVSSPVTIGFLKPVILLPLATINNLTPQQLEAILLHELSHIRRYDYFINLIINFIQTLLYFNPFVKAFVKIVEREREKTCDEMVLQFQYDSHEYASALLILERNNRLSKPLAVAASGKKNDLLHRIELILGVSNKKGFSFNKLAGLLAALLCIIGLNALLIMSKPANDGLSVPFAQLSSPFYLFSGENNSEEISPSIATEKKSTPVFNHIVKAEATAEIRHESNPSPLAIAANTADDASIAYINAASYEPVEIAAPLKNYQEEQVKQAAEASKKILENVQWKVIEKSIADVLNQKEKEEVKTNYLKEASKINVNELEAKLRVSYDKIDWDKINDQIGLAINQIRYDSLQSVYSQKEEQLAQVHKELSANNLKGIPDTDITLKEVEQKKLELNKVLKTLRILRGKKIVHL